MQTSLADRFDDGPFEAALDAFAQSQGFAIGKDKNRAIARTHEYRHPGGIDITCTVLDTSTATAMLSNLSGVLGSRSSGIDQQAEQGDGQHGPEGRRRRGGRRPRLAGDVAAQERQGVVARRRQGRPHAHRHHRGVDVPEDQLSWLKAWAAVALPVV